MPRAFAGRNNMTRNKKRGSMISYVASFRTQKNGEFLLEAGTLPMKSYDAVSLCNYRVSSVLRSMSSIPMYGSMIHRTLQSPSYLYIPSHPTIHTLAVTYRQFTWCSIHKAYKRLSCTAENGSTCVRLPIQCFPRPDLILMDVCLPISIEQ
ncbi:uncharacterized protein BO80DRAFT_432684 [Aspergillus ibericus CBS 121593]|uniref:Uncharacterized protein n=1 Tax=Aspergillus ibericus CBS 121593 TaxID=1448316 RepID=A0A395HB52_9EURO|nr:hypothetical protein BO80DRAFT_432684 [Aspergillus ibericus CBS 121593]RAL03434.1 hypothetical protein BO80DRAFT_432684 [Aspergillus ibericus CBS 121593]